MESLFVNTPSIPVLVQSGLDKIGGLILRNAVVICEMLKTSWHMKKTPYERRFKGPVIPFGAMVEYHPISAMDQSRRHFKGPIIPFGSMVEYHPISAKDMSRLHQFGPEVTGMFIGCALFAGEFRRGRQSSPIPTQQAADIGGSKECAPG